MEMWKFTGFDEHDSVYERKIEESNKQIAYLRGMNCADNVLEQALINNHRYVQQLASFQVAKIEMFFSSLAEPFGKIKSFEGQKNIRDFIVKFCGDSCWEIVPKKNVDMTMVCSFLLSKMGKNKDVMMVLANGVVLSDNNVLADKVIEMADINNARERKLINNYIAKASGSVFTKYVKRICETDDASLLYELVDRSNLGKLKTEHEQIIQNSIIRIFEDKEKYEKNPIKGKNYYDEIVNVSFLQAKMSIQSRLDQIKSYNRTRLDEAE